MKKFIVVYIAPMSAMARVKKISPKDAKKGMEAWKAWAKKTGSGIVDLGTPLGHAMKITKADIMPGNPHVVGYSILQAESMDKVLELLKNHPHLQWAEGCEIDVYESLPIPGVE